MKLQITLEVNTAEELLTQIQNFVNNTEGQPLAQLQMSVPELPQQVSTVQTNPTAVPIANAVPVTPVAPAQPVAVPTSAPTYTLDQLAVAATSLLDRGANIAGMLSNYNVQALTQLPPELYGTFAADLRAAGAQI